MRSKCPPVSFSTSKATMSPKESTCLQSHLPALLVFINTFFEIAHKVSPSLSCSQTCSYCVHEMVVVYSQKNSGGMQMKMLRPRRADQLEQEIEASILFSNPVTFALYTHPTHNLFALVEDFVSVTIMHQMGKRNPSTINKCTGEKSPAAPLSSR